MFGILFSSPALAKTYHLNIARQEVNITGKTVKKITINGSIPGPTLHFTDGENVTIKVNNQMDENTSIHWHGLLVPGEMDGVPGLNGFAEIAPGTSFSYHFTIRQSGTYWYHSHTKGQEQEGEYGSIVIKPKGVDPVKSDRDYVVVLSDYTDEESSSIFANLKMFSDYYQYARLTIGDFFVRVKEKGFRKAVEIFVTKAESGKTKRSEFMVPFRKFADTIAANLPRKIKYPLKEILGLAKGQFEFTEIPDRLDKMGITYQTEDLKDVERSLQKFYN